MKPEELISALVDANGLSNHVLRIPGAKNHHGVINNTGILRSAMKLIANLPPEKQAALTRSVAVYESSVGGIGSPSLLFLLFQIIDDPDHLVFDWVIQNTNAYDYYSKGAKSFAALNEFKAAIAMKKAARRRKEDERVANAKKVKAEDASAKLIKAIRRGDEKAVEALLLKGADPNVRAEDGMSATQIAEQLCQSKILTLLQMRCRVS